MLGEARLLRAAAANAIAARSAVRRPRGNATVEEWRVGRSGFDHGQFQVKLLATLFATLSHF